MNSAFWQYKSLAEMTSTEWESLCDSCAKCCLQKLEDEATGEVHYTGVVCRQLDLSTCRCANYQHRRSLVPDCVTLSPADVDRFHWLPATCAYRLVAEGRALPDWHHLVSGDTDSVHRMGMSVRGRVLSEDHVHPAGLEEHIVRWVN